MKQKLYSLVFILPLVLAYSGINMPVTPDKKYVCLPCGYSCDRTEYDKPGKCSFCGMDLVDKETIKFENIDFAKLCERMHANKGIVLLDVRSSGEFNNTNKEIESFGRFKDALNINIVELEHRVGELEKYKDSEIAVYCSHSHRSPQATYFLTTHGFKNVKNVSGGVSILQNGTAPGCVKDQYITFSTRK